MAALRTLREIYGRHFPLCRLGLELDDIAYLNVVRCRTSKNALPGQGLVSICIDAHLKRWLELLEPRVVIFLGTWAFKRAAHIVRELNIPCGYIDRNRSLDSAALDKNRRRVIALVRRVIGNAR